MSIMLPDPLGSWILPLLGIMWPAADEDKMRQVGDAYRQYAKDIRELAWQADQVVTGQLLYGNEGQAFDAMRQRWAQLSDGDNGGLLGTAADDAETIAGVFDIAADIVVVIKIIMIIQMIELAMELLTDQAAAPETLGASEAVAAGEIMVQRALMQRLVAFARNAIISLVKFALKLAVANGVVSILGNMISQGVEMQFGMRQNLDMGAALSAGLTTAGQTFIGNFDSPQAIGFAVLGPMVHGGIHGDILGDKGGYVPVKDTGSGGPSAVTTPASVPVHPENTGDAAVAPGDPTPPGPASKDGQSALLNDGTTAYTSPESELASFDSQSPGASESAISEGVSGHSDVSTAPPADGGQRSAAARDQPPLATTGEAPAESPGFVTDMPSASTPPADTPSGQAAPPTGEDAMASGGQEAVSQDTTTGSSITPNDYSPGPPADAATPPASGVTPQAYPPDPTQDLVVTPGTSPDVQSGFNLISAELNGNGDGQGAHTSTQLAAAVYYPPVDVTASPLADTAQGSRLYQRADQTVPAQPQSQAGDSEPMSPEERSALTTPSALEDQHAASAEDLRAAARLYKGGVRYAGPEDDVAHDGFGQVRVGDPNAFVVEAHGSGGELRFRDQHIDIESLPELLADAGWDGKSPLILACCGAGGEDGAADQLARMLPGVDIVATKADAWDAKGGAAIAATVEVDPETGRPVPAGLHADDKGNLVGNGTWIARRYVEATSIQDARIEYRTLESDDPLHPLAPKAADLRNVTPDVVTRLSADSNGNQSGNDENKAQDQENTELPSGPRTRLTPSRDGPPDGAKPVVRRAAYRLPAGEPRPESNRQSNIFKLPSDDSGIPKYGKMMPDGKFHVIVEGDLPDVIGTEESGKEHVVYALFDRETGQFLKFGQAVKPLDRYSFADPAAANPRRDPTEFRLPQAYGEKGYPVGGYQAQTLDGKPLEGRPVVMKIIASHLSEDEANAIEQGAIKPGGPIEETGLNMLWGGPANVENEYRDDNPENRQILLEELQEARGSFFEWVDAKMASNPDLWGGINLEALHAAFPRGHEPVPPGEDGGRLMRQGAGPLLQDIHTVPTSAAGQGAHDAGYWASADELHAAAHVQGHGEQARGVQFLLNNDPVVGHNMKPVEVNGAFVAELHARGGQFLLGGKSIDASADALPQELAAAGWDGKEPIALVSCRAGAPNGFADERAAEQLARKLPGVWVVATSSDVLRDKNGNVLATNLVEDTATGRPVPDLQHPGTWTARRYNQQTGTLEFKTLASDDPGRPPTPANFDRGDYVKLGTNDDQMPSPHQEPPLYQGPHREQLANGPDSHPAAQGDRGLTVVPDDVHGLRVPEMEFTPRMESYAAQPTQPLVDFRGLTPDQIKEREPLTGTGFGSHDERAQLIGEGLATEYGSASSSKVSIGQTRMVAAELNKLGLSQEDAITAWKAFYTSAMEGPGPAYRYMNGDVVIAAANAGFKDTIVIDSRGFSAPGITTSNDISGGTLGPVSPRPPGPDLSADTGTMAPRSSTLAAEAHPSEVTGGPDQAVSAGHSITGGEPGALPAKPGQRSAILDGLSVELVHDDETGSRSEREPGPWHATAEDRSATTSRSSAPEDQRPVTAQELRAAARISERGVRIAGPQDEITAPDMVPIRVRHPDAFVIEVHGEGGLLYVDGRPISVDDPEFTRVLEAAGWRPGQPLILGSCQADPVAERLAAKFPGTDVVATDALVWRDKNGNLLAASEGHAPDGTAIPNLVQDQNGNWGGDGKWYLHHAGAEPVELRADHPLHPTIPEAINPEARFSELAAHGIVPRVVTSDEVEREYGLLQHNQKMFQTMADRYHLIFDVRPSNSDSPDWLRQGGVPKPEAIKAKTINELDARLAPYGMRATLRRMVGAVGLFDPVPPVREPGESDASWAKIQDRYQQRLEEYAELKPKLDHLEAEGKFKVRSGVVYPFDPVATREATGDYPTLYVDQNGQAFALDWADNRVTPVDDLPPIGRYGPPVAGDHDIFNIRDLAGRPLAEVLELRDNETSARTRMFIFRDSDGSVLDIREDPQLDVWYQKLVNEAGRGPDQILDILPQAGELLWRGMGVRHGAHMQWTPKNDFEQQIYDKIVNSHQQGGDPLVRFQPGQPPMLVWADTPV